MSQSDADAIKKLLEKGSNTVRGSALIPQQGGGVVTCAGRTVLLIPATPYSAAVIREIFGPSLPDYRPDFGSGNLPVYGDPKYGNLSFRTQCDAQGYFKFDNLKDGSFFVLTAITWHVRPYITEGGMLKRFVVIAGGEMKEIVLSPH